MTKIQTNDGSFTLLNEEYGESYHSVTCGALRESMQKHVIPSFGAVVGQKGEINILDICFGLGFNTLAAIAYAKREYKNLKIKIFSPEMDGELIASLGSFEYPKEIENEAIISSVAKELFYEDEFCSVKVLLGDAREILEDCKLKFDIVFQDAFSPAKNRMLWSLEYFERVSRLLSDKAVITTYSRSSKVKMALHQAGLNIYEIEHPSGIRKSTIASNFRLPNLQKIDMLTKIKNSPDLRPIRDAE